jgi:hypothetical protein
MANCQRNCWGINSRELPCFCQNTHFCDFFVSLRDGAEWQRQAEGRHPIIFLAFFCLELHYPVDLIVDEIMLLDDLFSDCCFALFCGRCLSLFFSFVNILTISFVICRVTEASGSGYAASWTASSSRTPASTTSASAARRPGSTWTRRSCSPVALSIQKRTAYSLRSVARCRAVHAVDCGAVRRCKTRANARFLPSAAALRHDLIRSNARRARSAARNGIGTGFFKYVFVSPAAGSTASPRASGGK